MYLCTQRCEQLFSQTNVHMMPAPRSPHMLTACVWPAGRAALPGCARGQAAPDHAGARPASPGKLTGASPPPPGPEAPRTRRRAAVGAGRPGARRRLGAPAGLAFFLNACAAPAQPPAPPRRAGGRGAGPAEDPPAAPPPPPPPPRVRRAPPPPAPPPRARPAQAARVCFAARPPPPPPRASRAHLCLAGPHSSLPSVECLSRWLLRTVWLFPLVTAFTFCLNSSPRSRPSPARRLPPPPAACAPAPPPAAGAPPLVTWGPAPRSPPPPARRPSPAPSARRGYNCLSPPGGVILGVVGGGGGGEEGNFLVPPFPGGGERRRRWPPFPGKRQGPDPGAGAAAGRGGGRGPRWSGGRQAAVVVGGMGASGTCIFQLGPSGS